MKHRLNPESQANVIDLSNAIDLMSWPVMNRRGSEVG